MDYANTTLASPRRLKPIVVELHVRRVGGSGTCWDQKESPHKHTLEYVWRGVEFYRKDCGAAPSLMLLEALVRSTLLVLV